MSNIFNGTEPLDYDSLCSYTRQFKRQYKFFQSFTLGKSVLGRNITVFLLGSGRPAVIYCGAHHATEYITAMLLLKFTEDICAHYDSGEQLLGFDLRKILQTQSVYIIPMLNPDGVEIHLNGAAAAGQLRDTIKKISGGDLSNWQANARGVDLNHNYNAGWDILRQMEIKSGITGPAPRQFGGYRAESEPETHALCNLCRRIPFGRAYALHSQGEIIYWDYGDRTPKNAREIGSILASSSGYQLDEPEGMASHGGFKDWFINVFARPGFTIEFGMGKNPLQISDFRPIYEKTLEMMLLSLII